MFVRWLKNLLPTGTCMAIAGLYEQEDLFRNRVVMARHSFGRGEYQYFDYPLPEVVATLRAAIYPPLAGIANC